VVAHGAGIAIVTIVLVGREETAALLVAGVIGAGTGVVANDWATDTFAGDAVVGNSARVTIGAFPVVKGCVDASCLWIAAIKSTLDTVVAGRFVHQTIAVVVEAVALFQSRYLGVAIGESLLGANTVSSTDAFIVLCRARRRKTEGDRFLGAGARPCVSHALLQTAPIDCLCRQT